MAMNEHIVTDSLGFRLSLQINFVEMKERGRHLTHEEDGKVPIDAEHVIEIHPKLEGAELSEVASHEAYHLFFAIRDHITADEETQANVFGQLVKYIIKLHGLPH